jgi:hypothetical protein
MRQPGQSPLFIPPQDDRLERPSERLTAETNHGTLNGGCQVGSVEESGLKVRLSRRNACGQLLALFPTQELVIVMTSDAYGERWTECPSSTR